MAVTEAVEHPLLAMPDICPGLKQMPTLLLVCTANQSRSPVAAALFTAHAAARGETERWKVCSAGTWAAEGSPAVQPAVEMLAARGLDLAAHRSQRLQAADLEEADVILVMTRNQREAILAEFPGVGPKVRLLSQAVGQEYDIADPVGGNRDEYAACVAEIDRLLQTGFEQIAAWAQSTEAGRS